IRDRLAEHVVARTKRDAIDVAGALVLHQPLARLSNPRQQVISRGGDPMNLAEAVALVVEGLVLHHKLFRWTSYSSCGTAFSGGFPPRHRTTSRVASISIRVRQSTDIDPMCEVSRHRSIFASGPEYGSCSKTSIAAPPR